MRCPPVKPLFPVTCAHLVHMMGMENDMAIGEADYSVFDIIDCVITICVAIINYRTDGRIDDAVRIFYNFNFKTLPM